MRRFDSLCRVGLWYPLIACSVFADSALLTIPSRDERATRIMDLNTPRAFPDMGSVNDWRQRAQEIRRHALFCCGLWPMPPKGPLNPKIEGRVDRVGYCIERVSLEIFPGFRLAGNLYRPLGRGNGPFPAVLNPHGHWAKGRLEDSSEASVVARCSNFAGQGIIAFAYDMIGCNDTLWIPNHDSFPREPELQLWNISLMGLQTWNSMRALDFLESLPQVDAKRISCTGASGGGTQTFMLACVDPRVSVSAPVVMVSHSMQGGCQCENAPGLRVDYSNMEIAAAAAPRAQILVAATGDWTKTTPTLEGPSISNVYRLLGKSHQFKYVCFPSDHNYNQTSREAVYAWFARWLLRHPEPDSIKEQPYTHEPDEVLRLRPDGRSQDQNVNVQGLIRHLKDSYRAQWEALLPKNPQSLRAFRDLVKPAWESLLQLRWPEQQSFWIESTSKQVLDNLQIERIHFGVRGLGCRLPATHLMPVHHSRTSLVVLVDSGGQGAFLDGTGSPRGLARAFLDQRYQVMLLDVYQTGDLRDDHALSARNYSSNYFTTYNRTDLQERVQDLVSACQFARLQLHARRVLLCGSGAAGIWTALAAPAAHALIADCGQLDLSNNAVLLGRELFLPGVQRLGGFEGVACLAVPNPVLLHNVHDRFNRAWLEKVYEAGRASSALRVQPALSDPGDLVAWALQNIP
jgi:dienelactone hydrolase